MSGDTKYVVRNREGETLAPGTYFVLRAGDKFAYAALWQYSQVLQLAREIGEFSEPEKQRILDLQLHVAGLAEAWQAVGGKKVPD